MRVYRLHKIGVFGLLAVLVLAVVPTPSRAQIAADGSLDSEVGLVLDLNGDGIPDILAGRIGVAFFQLDNWTDGSWPVGPDGFRDAGLRVPDLSPIPPCSIIAQCADPEFTAPSIRSGLNTGKLTIIYLPDEDGFDPGDPEGTDNSLLYVGMDIFNGDSRTLGDYPGECDENSTNPGDPCTYSDQCDGGFCVGEDTTFHVVDFVDTFLEGDICEDGVMDYDGDQVPDELGVPFDVDADGNPQRIGRWDPLPECPAPSLLFDDDQEYYGFTLYECSSLRGFFPTSPIGDIRLVVDNQQTVIEYDIDFPGVTVPETWIESFPDPNDPASDETTDLPSLGARDVEFIVRHIDTIIDLRFPTTDFNIDRYRIAQGGVVSRSDADGDSAAEDKIIAEWFLPLPRLEVTKEMRCVGEGDDAWRATADALPGSRVEFKIEVENTGNVPLSVVLEDVLQGIPLDAGHLNSLLVMLHRPGDAAGVEVTFDNAPTFDPPMNRDFVGDLFDRGFLDDLDGTPSCLGVLNGVNVCDNPEVPVLGDRVVITFAATVDTETDYCTDILAVDILNSVTATGDPDFTRDTNGDGVCDDLVQACPVVSGDPCQFEGNEASDLAGDEVYDTDPAAVDSERELIQGFDDNVVAINAICRDLNFVKEVGIAGDEDSFTTGDISLDVPTIQAGGILALEFRYSGHNLGEIAEDVTIIDDFLCLDIAAMQAAFPADFAIIACPLCPTGEITISDVPAYDPLDPDPDHNKYSTSCVIEFSSQDALRFFLGLNDAREDCTADDPSVTEPDSDCYRNCATARAHASDLTGICNSTPDFEIDSYATLCNYPCRLEVTKRVRCVDDCTNQNPLGEWYDEATGAMPILPGACVQYEIEVENTAIDPAVPICLLRFTDLLGGQPGQIALPDPIVAELEVVGAGGTAFCDVPAGFNVDNTAFTWDPSTCPTPLPSGTFDPGDKLYLRFCACVPATADPADTDPANDVTVEGASDCEPDVIWGCVASSFVDLDIKECDITVTKEASCDEPRNQDGSLNTSAIWEDAVDALPGAMVAFKIVVCNAVTSEVDLTSIDINDVLDCGDWFEPLSVEADIDGQDVLDCICPSGICIEPDDLNGLKDLTGCGPGALAPGACLTITFEVMVPADFDVVGQAVDCTNEVTVGGFAAGVCAPATACDEESASATINVLIPQPLECEKQVCVDTDEDGVCDIDLGTDIEVPCDIAFPFRLIYEMTVTNPAASETDMVLVELCDLELVTDAADANLVGVSCELDVGGCKRCGLLTPGDSCTALCTFEVPSRAHWLDFAGRDSDDSPDCYSNTTTAKGDIDPDICHRGVTEPDDAECSARVCLVPPCELTVNKRVQCVDNCTDLTPVGDWYDDGTGAMPVLPGACVRYEVEVINSGVDPICLLQFTDLLSEQPDDIELPDPAVVELEVEGVFCTAPAEFNADGTAFTWDPADCPAALPDGTFNAGDVLYLRFCACIPTDADPVALDPKNTVTVNCATCPPSGADPVFCEVDGGKTDNVELDVKECDIEVTKEASCDEPRLGDGITLNPAAVWEDAVNALPGAAVAFKITVCNTLLSEVDITSIDLTDALSCDDWFVADSVVADLNGQDVTECICPGGVCGDFADLSGHKDLTACTPGLITPGECLTITFEVMVPADFDTVGEDIDCTNEATVGSFADMVCAPTGACDEESDSATINVLIPQPLECDKLVCVDTDNDGECDIDFGTDLEVPCNATFPLTLIYEMTVTNPAASETDMVGVKVCDLELITDAGAAGLNVISCELDAGGCKDCGTLAPGESCTARCEFRVPSRTHWLDFAGWDTDDNADCYSNTMTGEGDIDPSICDRDATGFENPSCSARVCVVPPCELLVSKRVQCVDNCTSQNPEGDWFEDLMPVLPGACVRYEIEVENDGDNSICQLRFTDLLTEQPGDIIPNLASVELQVELAGGGLVTCPPTFTPAFNTVGTPFAWDPADCPALGKDQIDPEDKVFLRFCACVPGTANPAPLDPVNTVTVQCATCPASGSDPVLCDDGDTDDVAIDIKECDIEVTKDVSCDEPRLPDGTLNPAAVWSPTVDVLPGTPIAFRIQVCNTPQSEVDITSVDLSDTLSCIGWFEAGSIVADIGDVDVTSCICPSGCPSFASLSGVKDLTACGPGGIAPGECLTITFMINVPSGYVLTGQDVDCRNDVTVGGITDICGPEGACDEGSDFATINVLVPSVECDKQVCADFNTDGNCETAFLPVLNLEDNDIDYPVQVIYQFTVRNIGETPLKEVVLCDADFLTDVLGMPAGVSFASCELDENPGPLYGCRTFPAGLALDAAESFQCVLRIESEGDWDAFKVLDGIYTPPGDPDGDLCYNNEATVTAEADLDLVDACGPDDPILLDSTCSAQVCLSPICIPPPCAPMTKIMFDIWNMNEVKFSGTEYCTWSWDETLMSQIAPPNHFLLAALQTNKGQARINGVQSDVVCGVDNESENVPLLGVAAKMLAFGNDHGMAGMPLVGFGNEDGWIGTSGVGTLPGPELGGTSASPKVDKSELTAGPVSTNGTANDPRRERDSSYPPEDNGMRLINRANISQKGSLLVFPKFEVKWDADGNIVQDTVLELTNDWVTDVTVQLYFVDGDMCVWADNRVVLTGNEPTYWSVATGDPKGLSPITALSDGCPDRDGDNPGGKRIRGYVLAWAVSPTSGLEIRWNHLKGTSTIVHYGRTAVWEYSAYAFRALVDVPNGEYLSYPLGVLELNGSEYDSAPDFLLLDFYAPGVVLESTGAPRDAIVEDTDLTFWAAIKNFAP